MRASFRVEGGVPVSEVCRQVGFSEQTLFTYVPVLRALSALEDGRPTDSVERLHIAVPYELAANGLNFAIFIWAVCIQPTCEARLSWPRTSMRRRPPSFRRFSIIVASWARIP